MRGSGPNAAARAFCVASSSLSSIRLAAAFQRRAAVGLVVGPRALIPLWFGSCVIPTGAMDGRRRCGVCARRPQAIHHRAGSSSLRRASSCVGLYLASRLEPEPDAVGRRRGAQPQEHGGRPEESQAGQHKVQAADPPGVDAYADAEQRGRLLRRVRRRQGLVAGLLARRFRGVSRDRKRRGSSGAGPT